jgi:hypothetical protein
MFGTIAGAGIPPIAALSPGIPSSTGESNEPPAQRGWRHPNQSHAGSSWTKAGAAFSGIVAPSTATPATPAANAVLASLPRTSETVTQLICRSFKRGAQIDRFDVCRSRIFAAYRRQNARWLESALC